MFAAAATDSEPSTPLKNELSQAGPVAARGSSVTVATPAKRVTFFKSGDAQFGGVRMAIHKRSFKCFDALLDDLSRRVPLPFGVRTITTPRGTHSIHHLEQLEDGGCYLCSDRRPVKPLGAEAVAKRPSAWRYSHPYVARRKPSRPDEVATTHSSQHYFRHPRRIVLVKNSDPAIRRSIILSRRMVQSLRVFMEEVSELMQYHVRKLYTLEGRKIDSVQSLMQCPGVLVCVGSEPFRPLVVESFRRVSSEKLPGLGSKPKSPVCSESYDSKRNAVNFGLETKKSVIHPRSDSSNRSTRFSLSSEKSYPIGLSMTPGNAAYAANCSHPKEALMNDDIEKRVIVNQDGSLSVEMKVRFRIHEDETLQWSTEIKKSLGTVKDSFLGNGEVQCLKLGKSERCSGPGSSATYHTEEIYGTKHQRQLEEAHCQNCCNYCQDYDIWKNPMHEDQGTGSHIRSSSSSASSHKFVRKKASVEGLCSLSESSEEYTEHMVHKTACFQQVAEVGDTRVEYSTISCCCSQGEVCTASRSDVFIEEKFESPTDDESRSSSAVSVGSKNMFKDQFSVKITQVSEDRSISSLSATSNSSKILQALREDLDDDEDGNDDDDLLQSENPDDCKRIRSVESSCSISSNRSVSSVNRLSPRPPNKPAMYSTGSRKSKHHSMSVSLKLEVPIDDHENTTSEKNDGIDHIISTTSLGSLRSTKLHCPQSELSDPISNTECVTTAESEENDSTLTSSISKPRNASMFSNNTDETNGHNVEKTTSAVLYTGTRNLGRSRKSNSCPHCGGSYRESPPGLKLHGNACDIENDEFSSRSFSAMAFKTNASVKSTESEKSRKRAVTPMSSISGDTLDGPLGEGEGSEEEGEDSSVSAKLNIGKRSQHMGVKTASREVIKSNAINEQEENDLQERTASTSSVKTNNSQQCRKTSNSSKLNNDKTDGKRAASAMSAKTNVSIQSLKSDKSNLTVNSPLSIFSNCLDEMKVQEDDDDMVSTTSSRENISSKSKRSNKSCCNMSERVITPLSSTCDQEVKATLEEMGEKAERAESAMTDASAKLNKSNSKRSASHEAMETDSVKQRVSRETSHDSNGSERSKSPVNQDNIHNTEEVDKGALSVSTNALKDNSCYINDGDLIPPKICGIDEEKDELESEESSLSVKSGMTLKSHACHSEGSQRSGSSASVKLFKRDTDRVAEEVAETVISSTSTRSIVSEKLRKKYRADCSASNGELPLAPKTDSGDDITESVKSAASQVSTKSRNKKSASNGAEKTEEKVKNTEFLKNISEESKKFSDHYPCLSIITPNLDVPEVHPFNKTEETSAVAVRRKTCSKSKTCSSLNISGDGGHSDFSQSSCGSAQNKSPSRGSQPHSRDSSVTSQRAEDAENEDTVLQDISESGTVIEKAVASKTDSVKPSTNCSRNSSHQVTAVSCAPSAAAKPISCMSAQHTSGKVNTKKNFNVYENETSKGRRPNVSSPCLLVRGNNITLEVKGQPQSSHSLKIKSSKKTSKKDMEDNDISRQNLAESFSSQNRSAPKGTTKKKEKHVINHSNSHETDLSQSLFVDDLLMERPHDFRLDTDGSNREPDVFEVTNHRFEDDNKNDNSIRYKKRKNSSSSHQQRDSDISDVPSSLPNASPTEVVHEWLKKIPKDSPMYDVGDEFHDHIIETDKQINVSEKAELLSRKESIQLDEEKAIKENEEKEPKEADDQNVKCFPEESTQTKLPNVNISPITKSTSRETLPKRCQSSVQVMKVLLNPKFDRCNSLPEVSPVYGRKLSTSAKGLLDCLANLDLIDSEPLDIKDRDVRYNEVMSILQSLWLCDPLDSEQSTKPTSHRSVDDPKSSSGVDVSSGSAGSGKDSENGGVEQIQKIELTQNRGTPLGDLDTLQPLQEEINLSDDKDNTLVSSDRLVLDAGEPVVASDPATPDIARRVRDTPVSEELSTDEEKQNGGCGPHSNETIRSNASPKQITETPCSSNKSSGNDTLRLQDETESGLQEVALSGAPQLSKKVSQDPDPLWVLSLLKKIEKQFMTHYVNAMTEFKVRWDLDDSVMLDTMITELRDEVSKRIQASIDREMQKIQSRAGRGPKPPTKASRESSVQTEQRRRRLKVMHKKSVNELLQKSDDNYTVTGTDFSDQRSEEDYCPCDSCMKKKMASRLAERQGAVSSAPVMIDFDLRKILQMKRDPPALLKEESNDEKKIVNSEVLQDGREENQGEDNAMSERPHDRESHGKDGETDDQDVGVDTLIENNEGEGREDNMDRNSSLQEKYEDTADDTKSKESMMSNGVEDGSDEVNEEADTAGNGESAEEHYVENIQEEKAIEKDNTAAGDEKTDESDEVSEDHLVDQDQYAEDDDTVEESDAVKLDDGASVQGSTEDGGTSENPYTAEDVIQEDETEKQTDDCSVQEEKEDREIQSNKDTNISYDGQSGEDEPKVDSGEAIENVEAHVMETEEDKSVEEDTTEIDPKDEGVEEDNTEIDPKDEGVEEDNTEIDPKDEGVEEDNTEIDPKDEGVEEDNTEIDPKDEGVEEDNTEIDPKDESVEEDNTEIDPKDEGVEEDNTEVYPKDKSVEEDSTDIDPKDEGVEENSSAIERQDTGNSDADVQESPEDENYAEADAEDSDTDTSEKQNDSDTTENSMQARGTATVTAEDHRDEPEEPGQEEQEIAKEQRRLLKGITRSSIESQSGSIESAMDQERKLKDAETSFES